LTRTRWLWRNVVEHHVLERGLALPGYVGDLRTATMHELQHGGVRAAKFDRVWSANTISAPRQLLFDSTPLVLSAVKAARAVPPHQLGAHGQAHALAQAQVQYQDDTDVVLPTAWSCVQHVECLPGDTILTVHSSQHLVLWRVPRGGDEARHTDMHALIAGQPFVGLVVDRTPGPTTRICVSALGFNQATLCVSRFDPLHATLGPIEYYPVDMAPKTLWALKGDLILYADPPMILDTRTRLVRFLIQPDPQIVQVKELSPLVELYYVTNMYFWQPTPVIAAQFLFDDLVLVVQRQAILVMKIAPQEAVDLVGTVPFHTETEYQIEASISLAPDLALLCRRPPASSSMSPQTCPASGGFASTSAQVPTPTPAPKQVRIQPVAVVVGISPTTMHSTPLFLDFLDCHSLHHSGGSDQGQARSQNRMRDQDQGIWRAGAKASQPIPPSATGVQLGRSGRGIWQENRAPGVVAAASGSFSARPSASTPLVAGSGSKVLPQGVGVDVPRRREKEKGDRPVRCIASFDVPILRDGVLVDVDTIAPGTDTAEATDADAAIRASLLRVHAGALYARQCGMGEVITRKYGMMAATIDDGAGRIVLGNRDGTVQVLDFT
jgi:hypothetical protein